MQTVFIGKFNYNFAYTYNPLYLQCFHNKRINTQISLFRFNFPVLAKPFFVTGLSGDRFHFDENGDGPARYNIIHFKQLTPGKYQWVRVGEYLEGTLELNMSGEETPLLLDLQCYHIVRIFFSNVSSYSSNFFFRNPIQTGTTEASRICLQSAMCCGPSQEIRGKRELLLALFQLYPISGNVF